jgi:hypothetical protein
VFIGTAGFSAAGELRYQQVGGETVIQANTNNATGTIEFELRVFGSHARIADDLFSSVNSLVSANGRRQATSLPEVGARRTAISEVGTFVATARPLAEGTHHPAGMGGVLVNVDAGGRVNR